MIGAQCNRKTLAQIMPESEALEEIERERATGTRKLRTSAAQGVDSFRSISPESAKGPPYRTGKNPKIQGARKGKRPPWTKGDRIPRNKQEAGELAAVPAKSMLSPLRGRGGLDPLGMLFHSRRPCSMIGCPRRPAGCPSPRLGGGGGARRGRPAGRARGRRRTPCRGPAPVRRHRGRAHRPAGAVIPNPAPGTAAPPGHHRV